MILRFRAKRKPTCHPARRRCYEKWRYQTKPRVRSQASKARARYRDAHRSELPGLKRKQHLQRKFGITPVQYEALLKRQGGVCAVCRKPPKRLRLAVEHDHVTGRIRCLACFYCNRYRIGGNTAETARRVLAILESDFDGRNL